jgi:intermembrane space import and assembly protein 40
MQDCFRQHPEMYGAELEDDEDEVEQELRAREVAKVAERPSIPPKSQTQDTTPAKAAQESEPKVAEAHRDSSAAVAKGPLAGDEGGELLPKAAYDATSKN